MIDNSPIIEFRGMRFLNVPHARDLVEEVIEHDCYELLSLPRGCTLIDCGAFYGEASIFAAWHGHHCVAVEPSHQSFRIMQLNMDLNSSKSWIHAMNVSVGNGEPLTHCYRRDHPSGSGITDVGGCEKSVVDSHSMATIIGHAKRRFPVSKRFAVKMDVEGSEGVAFKDLEWLEDVVFVAMETHNHDSDYYESRLKDAGFKDVKLTGTGLPPRVAWDKSMTGGLVIARR